MPFRAGPGRLLVPVMVLAALMMVARPARADRLAQLAYTLSHDHSEKARIGAAVALGRSRDPRSLRPLIHALGDSSNVVRAVAATGLGYLGDHAALSALERATSDRDRTVRRHVLEAIAQIREQKQQRSGSSRRGRAVARSGLSHSYPRRGDRLSHYEIVPRESPRYAPSQVYVVLKSAQDKSSGRAPSRVRLMRANHMRSLMMAELQSNRQVTLMASEAERPDVEPYAIDITMEKLDRRVRGPYVEIECSIRVAVSNRQGKMLSFLTGGAKVQVPRRTFRRRYERELKLEAMENAVKSVHQDLIAYLANRPS